MRLRSASGRRTEERAETGGAVQTGGPVLLLLLLLAVRVVPARQAFFEPWEAGWMVAPMTPVPLVVCTPVENPPEAPDTNGRHGRFVLTDQVNVHRLHLIMVSLFGGLYGP